MVELVIISLPLGVLHASVPHDLQDAPVMKVVSLSRSLFHASLVLTLFMPVSIYSFPLCVEVFIYIGAELEGVQAVLAGETISLLPPNVVTGDLYNPLELSCIATGNPAPTVEWFRVNETTPLSNVLNGRLMIDELGLLNRGFYYCRASNEHLGQSTTVVSEPILQLNITGMCINIIV